MPLPDPTPVDAPLATPGELANLAKLMPEDLRTFASKALAELPPGSEARRILFAAMAKRTSAALTNSVLLDPDLFRIIFSHFDLPDTSSFRRASQVTSVCTHWRQHWRTLLVRNKTMWRQLEPEDVIDEDFDSLHPAYHRVASVLALRDASADLWLCVALPDRKCIHLYDTDDDGSIGDLRDTFEREELWGGDMAWAGGACFVMNHNHAAEAGSLGVLKLHNFFTATLAVAAEAGVRELTEDEERLQDFGVSVREFLRVHDQTVYILRPPMVDVYDAATLTWQRSFQMDFRLHRAPIESAEASQLVHFVYDGQLFAMTRTGQLMDMPQGNLTYPVAMDLFEDRLYVLDEVYHDVEDPSDDHDGQYDLWLHALTLDGRPTQPPLQIRSRVIYEESSLGMCRLTVSRACAYISWFWPYPGSGMDRSGQISRVVFAQ